MSNDVIFYTQIGSIVAFIVSLFVLYSLLVNQKDATIELLREKNAFLEKQLESFKEATPDILVEVLQKRLRYLTEEMTQLAKDVEGKEALEKEVAALKLFKERIEITNEMEEVRKSVAQTSRNLREVAQDVEVIREGLSRTIPNKKPPVK